jgi:hypothetical protein
VPIIHSESANFKVFTEESDSLSSLSSHESVASNRSDNNSDKISNLVNFSENYVLMLDMESIVNKMGITMNEAIPMLPNVCRILVKLTKPLMTKILKRLKVYQLIIELIKQLTKTLKCQKLWLKLHRLIIKQIH